MHPKEMMELLLDKHDGDIHVVFNGRHEGVKGIPESAQNDDGLVVVRIVLNEPRPVRNLEFDEHGWGAALSFGGVEDFAVVPWASISAFVVAGYRIRLAHQELNLVAASEPARSGLTVVK